MNESVLAGSCDDDWTEITGAYIACMTLQAARPVVIFQPPDPLPGAFIGFSEDGRSFSLRTPTCEVLDCEISRFSISQDTAQEYTRQQQKSPPMSSSKLDTQLHASSQPWRQVVTMHYVTELVCAIVHMSIHAHSC